MKKIIFILFLGAISTNLFAQKTIENPECGFSTVPGSVTKIALLDTTTVLHFHIKLNAGGRFSVPKQSYIQDLSGDEKLFLLKAEGIDFGKSIVMPESGEVFYKLYFPKLKDDVKTIDFGEANDGGNWAIYDLVIVEDESETIMPKDLRGNWLLTDGSNKWDYSFNSKNAIIDREIWNYKSVDKKGKKYTIVLENENGTKTVYAKQLKNSEVAFGQSPKDMQTYSLEKTANPNYQLANNVAFAEPIFNLDSATYSGIINNYTTRAGEKTGTMYVNNVFSGNQESHLIKIADDGSFSVTVPIAYPQSTFVRMSSGNYSVFIEPGKETFHVIDGKSSFFGGDCAQVNSDLQALEFIRYFDYRATMENIGVTSPEDYKKICFDIKDKELNALEDFKSKNFVSAKAFQIKKIQIELSAYQNTLGYEMQRGSLQRFNEKEENDEKKKPFEDFEVNETYYNFIPKDIINDKLALLSNDYYFFINRLMYAEIFKGEQNSRLTLVDFSDWLQKNNKELTAEELEMVEMSKQIETPEIRQKEADFREVHGKVEQAFYKKHTKDLTAYNDYMKESGLKTKHNHFLLNMAAYLKAQGVSLTNDEMIMMEAIKTLKTDEELEKESVFNEAYGKIRGEFNKKYMDNYSEISKDKRYTDRDDKIKAFFGRPEAFLYDVIRLQSASERLEDYQVYTDTELASIQNELKDSFLSDYLAEANERTKASIEANKTKGGFTVNEVDKSEGDELFDAMIEKFKGKVVYVDFWATWCGPCRSGISRITPLKEEMKNEDVVFLYITNHTSPEGTWKNAIPNIKGEHYRVSADEWNYLSDKFKISGIPHYTLVNRNGEVVKPKMGHLPNDKLKSILKSELKK